MRKYDTGLLKRWDGDAMFAKTWGRKPRISVLLLFSVLVVFLASAPFAFADQANASADDYQRTIAQAERHYQAFSNAGLSEQSNLVLFVKFNGDTSTVLNDAYIYSDGSALKYSNYQYLKHDFVYSSNDAGESAYGSSTSLQAYMTMASNGRYNVTSYFPQEAAAATISTTGGVQFAADQVAYIQLNQTEAHYRENQTDEELVTDVFSAFNTLYPSYNAAQLDADGDGAIDNVTFVFQLQANPSSQNDAFWPHMSSSDSWSSVPSLAKKNLSTYLFMHTYSVPDNTDSLQKISLGLSSGVLVHEYLHTLGLQDYYNNTMQTANGGSPASPWDIMADNSYNYFMLANTRALLGWTTIPTLSSQTASKTTNADNSTTYTCTLNAPFTTGNQAVEVTTPMNTNERFVLEYRKKTSMSNDPLLPDSSLHLNNSGLIVYRVNESVTSKSNYFDADGFYVYVFRPGETGTNAGGGSTFESTLETAGYAAGGLTYGARTTFGKSDLAAMPAATSGDMTGNSTIYYSNGSNSGITVNVTAQTDSSITFEVTMPDYSALGLWDQVGSTAGAGAAGDVSMAIGDDGMVYQSYRDMNSGAIAVRSWNGNLWTSRGTVASDVSNVSSTSTPKLKCIGSTLYCVYASFSQSGSSNAVVCKKLTSDGWADAGSISTNSDYCYQPTPAVLDGSLYVLIDKGNTTAQLYKLSGTTFAKVGGSLNTEGILSPSLVSANGKTYVVCGDSSANGLKIYRLDGSTWTRIYNTGTQWSRPTAAVAAENTVVAFSSEDNDHANNIVAVQSDGTLKSYTFSKVSGNIMSASMVYAGDYVYLSLYASTGVTSVWYAPLGDLSSWTQLGQNAYSQTSSMDTIADGTNMYVGVASSGDAPIAAMVSHSLASAKTTHTVTFVDADGTTVLKKQVVGDGGAAVAPASPMKTGYTFAQWDKAFTNVTSDLVIKAVYTVNMYTLASSASAGGAISPAGTVSVEYGSSRTYTIAPNSGYAIEDVVVDSVSVGAVSSYAFSNVAANHTISASFVSMSLEGAEIENVSMQTYTGYAIEPMPTITLHSTILRPNVDYALSYQNNVDVGTATIVVTGRGAYSGIRSCTFDIVSNYCQDVLGVGSKGAAYTINTRLSQDRLVDISGRSTADGGNAQMYRGNETPAQRFFVEWHVVGEGNYGYYTFRNVYSGKVLDVKSGRTAQGTNVQQWSWNGSGAQQWTLIASQTNGYWTVRNVKSGRVLDVAGNSTANGANLQIWDSNRTSAQEFRFNACKTTSVVLGKTYVIRNVANSKRVVDVAAASTANGANVQLYNSNGTAAQYFTFSYDAATGYYTIVNVKSNKVIDVASAGVPNGSNVQQYSSNGTWAQKWALKNNADGTFTFFCACNGRCFDLAGASTANGTNIWCWDANGTRAQKWRIDTM